MLRAIVSIRSLQNEQIAQGDWHYVGYVNSKDVFVEYAAKHQFDYIFRLIINGKYYRPSEVLFGVRNKIVYVLKNTAQNTIDLSTLHEYLQIFE